MRNISLSLVSRQRLPPPPLHLYLYQVLVAVTIGGCHEVWMSRQHSDDKTTKNVDDTIVRRETARDGEKGDNTKKTTYNNETKYDD